MFHIFFNQKMQKMYTSTNIEEQFLFWIKNLDQLRQKNIWLYDKTGKVYLRKNQLSLTEKKVALDVATVEIYERGLGRFHDLLSFFFANNPFDMIIIENVCNNQFAKMLTKEGWHCTNSNDLSPTFYMKNNEGTLRYPHANMTINPNIIINQHAQEQKSLILPSTTMNIN